MRCQFIISPEPGQLLKFTEVWLHLHGLKGQASMPTGIHVAPMYWDAEREQVKWEADKRGVARTLLGALREEVHWYTRMLDGENTPPHRVVEHLEKHLHTVSKRNLLVDMDRLRRELSGDPPRPYDATLQAVVKLLAQFTQKQRGTSYLLPHELDGIFAVQFACELTMRLAPSTRRTYLRAFLHLVRLCVKEGYLLEQTYQFMRVALKDLVRIDKSEERLKRRKSEGKEPKGKGPAGKQVDRWASQVAQAKAAQPHAPLSEHDVAVLVTMVLDEGSPARTCLDLFLLMLFSGIRRFRHGLLLRWEDIVFAEPTAGDAEASSILMRMPLAGGIACECVQLPPSLYTRLKARHQQRGQTVWAFPLPSGRVETTEEKREARIRREAPTFYRHLGRVAESAGIDRRLNMTVAYNTFLSLCESESG
ncbi:MAG: hypothetical protein RhofKO_17370 [Rhodothermales bacterium]